MATTEQKKVVYTVFLVAGDTKYNVTPVMESLDRFDLEGQIAQQVSFHLWNVKVNGSWLSGIVKPRNRVFVYADDGTKNEEVFRGYLWSNKYNSSNRDRLLKLTAYDHLIYTQESEDTLYFSAGMSTKDVVSSICSKWGIPLSYSYSSITHAKLPLRGKIYELLTTDILDSVKKRTGKKYVIRSEKDIMYVKPEGANTTVYQFRAGKNVISTSSGWSMEGVITQVVIVGQEDDEGREPFEAAVTGNTSKYGTLQKVQERDEETTLEDAKLEAQATIDEYGEPKMEYEIIAADIPWIRKGDKVYAHAGDIGDRYLIVKTIDRLYTTKKCQMTLTLAEL